MSIRYLDVTLSRHKRKDRLTSNSAGARVCVCGGVCAFGSKTLRPEHKSLCFIHIPGKAGLLHHQRQEGWS